MSEKRAPLVRASDVATILGVNPYKTPFELWAEYTGRLKREESIDPLDPRAIGHMMEEPIARMYEIRTGQKVRRDPRDFTHPKYPWLVGHIDRRVAGKRRGVEIKNVGPNMATRWGPDNGQVADFYLPQVHAYLLLTQFEVFDIAAYFGGDDLRIYEVQPDPEWHDIIVQATHDFLHKHVIPDVPPEALTADDVHVLRKVYPGTSGESIDAPEGAEHWLAVHLDAHDKASRYATVAAEARAHLLSMMGEASVMRFPNGYRIERKLINRAGYTVEPTSYVTDRIVKPKRQKGDEHE